MWILDLINKKKQRQELSALEINFVIDKFMKNEILAPQMSALLMAIWFNGLTTEETIRLTQALIASGDQLDLTAVTGFKVDKHSTGGVGDKVTLIYGPLVASLGLKVAKLSGRGLGQTGGTIDKLAAIPNFNVNLTSSEFLAAIAACGMALSSQTQNLTPADQKIYALRDATGTVDSIPLIAASIMAKKLAMGSDAIVLDVKCGRGAFVTNLTDAKTLANLMLAIAKEMSVKVGAIITDMNQPLGMMIGNICEVFEAYQFLQGNYKDEALLEVVVSLAALSLVQAGKVSDFISAKKVCQQQLKSGAPLQYFEKFITNQGGDINFIANFNWNEHVKHVIEIPAVTSGFVYFHDCYALGDLAMKLGAGRINKTANIDAMAGIYLNKKTQSKVQRGDIVLTLYTNIDNASQFIKMAQELFTITQTVPVLDNIIYEVIT